jgi:putative ABC transport system permease protein
MLKAGRVRKRSELDVAVFMAVKNIFHRKAMLIMIIAIIGLGYLSTMFSSAIILGLKQTIEQKVINGVVGHIIIQPDSNQEYLEDVKATEKMILSIPHVVAVSPRMGSYITLIDKNSERINAQTMIIYPEKEYHTTSLSQMMLEGNYLTGAPRHEIIVGGELTKSHKMMPSTDAVDIRSGEIIRTIIQYGNNPIEIEMKVRGIYGQEFMFTDDYVYISESAVRDIYNITGEMDIASMIVVRVTDDSHTKEIAQQIKSMGVKGNVWMWHEKMGMLDQFINSLMIISQLTALIGVVIAFATIYIMVYINVLQRRSQIGMLKALGITEETILLSYVIQSVFYGLLGTVFGIILTRSILGYIDMNPIHMPMGYVRPVTALADYAMSSLFLLLSALFAGYMASKGVIREKILDAIFKG